MINIYLGRAKLLFLITFICSPCLISCRQKIVKEPVKIVFLHHSTGRTIWDGNQVTILSRVAGKINPNWYSKFFKDPQLPRIIKDYNSRNLTNYILNEIEFPKKSPYGWTNDPFDYYNIWVKNAGDNPYLEEPTLEILSKQYQVIIFKHCFPVCNIQIDKDSTDINSKYKSLGNYKLQYLAIREKLLEFPETKFILFTGAAQVKSQITEEEAKRAKEFFEWVQSDWDQPGDNIHLWDFYYLETRGDIFLKEEFARSSEDSHPNMTFAGEASTLLLNRIIDVIETEGAKTDLMGYSK